MSYTVANFDPFSSRRYQKPQRLGTLFLMTEGGLVISQAINGLRQNKDQTHGYITNGIALQSGPDNHFMWVIRENWWPGCVECAMINLCLFTCEFRFYPKLIYNRIKRYIQILWYGKSTQSSYFSGIGKRFLPNGPFSAFFNDFEIFNGPFLIILHRLLWAIFQVNGTMAHGPLPSQSLTFPLPSMLKGHCVSKQALHWSLVFTGTYTS